MQLIPIPIQSGRSARRPSAREQMLVQVKFMGLPVPGEPEPGVISRFISRVIGCLVAARP
ncbi:MAG TPA: hypothetical protein VGI57_03540 [Usitatibacter sp.]